MAKAPSARSKAAITATPGKLDMPRSERGKANKVSTVERALLKPGPLVYFRPYQLPIFTDKLTKIVVLEWSRQIGKSYTLANWAVDRLMQKMSEPGVKSWLIVVISNSRANGAEFGIKVSEAAEMFRLAAADVVADKSMDDATGHEFGLELDDCQFKLEVNMVVGGEMKRGRILVLSASPRTARGFSGDLILDEFAHHENAKAMWGAAEPIISSNPDFLCRIASTHNGPGSLFNKWIKTGMFPVNSVSRTKAWQMANADPVAPLKILSLKTGQVITPAEAREEAGDQGEYDQNYENLPSSESGSLISWDIIHGASVAPGFKVDENRWSGETIERLAKMPGVKFAGMDVGRHLDKSVLIVLQRQPNNNYRMVAMLTMVRQDSFHQRKEVEWLFSQVPGISRVAVDFSGVGTGLVDELIRGSVGYRCMGINFSTYVPIPIGLQADGRREERVPVTEVMAIGLCNALKYRSLEIPPLLELQNSLHLPERVSNPDGTRVRIAATRAKDESGNYEHADYFWALALAVYGAVQGTIGGFSAEDVVAVESSTLLFAGKSISFPDTSSRMTFA